MSRLKNARHFHAGKLRRTIDGLEYIDVAESDGKVFVSRAGLFSTPGKPKPYYGTLMKNGYYEVRVAGRAHLAHRVVAEVYLGEIPPGMEVDHVDADPKNNSVKNLRIVTSKENSRNPVTYAKYYTRHHDSVRKANAAHRKAVVGVRFGAAGVVGPFKSAREAAASTGISFKSISNSLRNKCKSAGRYVWMTESAWKKLNEEGYFNV